jgi:hypothetical protein
VIWQKSASIYSGNSVVTAQIGVPFLFGWSGICRRLKDFLKNL